MGGGGPSLFLKFKIQRISNALESCSDNITKNKYTFYISYGGVDTQQVMC